MAYVWTHNTTYGSRPKMKGTAFKGPKEGIEQLVKDGHLVEVKRAPREPKAAQAQTAPPSPPKEQGKSKAPAKPKAKKKGGKKGGKKRKR